MNFRFWDNIAFLFSTASIAGLVIGIVTMFIGRKFCGYVCPIGTLQEYLFKLRKVKHRLRYRVPTSYDRIFSAGKYVILIVTIFLVLGGKSSLFMSFCPVLTVSQLPSLLGTGLAIWLLILIGGLMTERLFCRYLCPYGALLNIFQRISRLFGFRRLMIKVNLETCINCCICVQNCPMNINLAANEFISDYNCIHCLICKEVCPREKCVTEEFANGSDSDKSL